MSTETAIEIRAICVRQSVSSGAREDAKEGRWPLKDGEKRHGHGKNEASKCFKRSEAGGFVLFSLGLTSPNCDLYKVPSLH